ncbi:MAG TPA: HAD family phosphatase [Puia sp.]|jgi:2-haloacid dehalogenase|nr:HAD family phosphatase [Puia sp.]
MNKIDKIVFDLGGVLIDWNPDYVYKTIFPDDKERKWFYENICTPDWNEEQDAGRTLQAATEELVKKFPGHEKNIRTYYDRWQEMLGGPIHETVEILHHLKHKTDIRLYALTNWSAETFPVALQLYDFLHWFEGRVVSGEEKTRKPFTEIYKRLVERYNIIPENAIYIDDNYRNLIPAKDLGFNIIHFQSPQQFKKELMKLLDKEF